MPSSDYPSKIVLVGFFVQERQAGSATERERFGQEIYDRYDHHIVAACAAATPPLEDPSPEARAIMAVMATRAKGSARKKQAENAVEAYLIHRGW
jgi:hypothetical protein